MMYRSDHRITRFLGVKDTLSVSDETLCSFVEIIRAGRFLDSKDVPQRFRKKIVMLRQCLHLGEIKEYQDEKKKLLGVTLAGVFREGRHDRDLTDYSGLVHVDLDKLTVEQVQSYREILEKDPFVLVVFVSASGRGLKVICWHPLGSEYHEQVYWIFRSHVQQLVTCHDEAIDDSVRNLSRLCFVSHDPSAYLNLEASPIVSTVEDLGEMDFRDMSQKEEENPEPPKPEKKSKSLFDASRHTIFDDGKSHEKYGAAVLDAACDMIRAAAPGQKHQTRLYRARTVAGYVAGGYIEESVALQRLISAALDNTDDPRLAEKDIRDGFEHGKREPLEVPDPDPQFFTGGFGKGGEEGPKVRQADPDMDEKLKKVKGVAEEFAEGSSEGEEKLKRKNPFILLRDFLTDVRPPQYLVQGVLEANSFVTLIGEPASGKSFLAIDWACCIASGHDWHGRTVKQGSVIYMAGEGQDNMKSRFFAWRDRFGKNPLDQILMRLDSPILNNQEVVQQTYEDLQEAIEVTGPPKLIVIDTLARHYGGDENDTQQMNRFVNCLQVLRYEYQCSVLIVHHVGKDKTKGSRGSSVLHGAVDASYMTERTNDLNDPNAPTKQFRLKNIKMKDGTAPKDQFLDLMGSKVHRLDGHPLYYDDGVTPVTSCYLLPNEEAAESFEGFEAGGSSQGKKPKEIEIKAFEAFLELWEKGKENLLESGGSLQDLTVDPEDWSSKCKSPKYNLSRFNVSDIRNNKRSAFNYFHSKVIVDRKHMILKETNEV